MSFIKNKFRALYMAAFIIFTVIFTIMMPDGHTAMWFILFRIRSERSPDGSPTNGLFGKMRGDWYVNGPKRLLRFRIWTNEEVGNRNLEDTSGWW